ncbi:MAG: ubiquitin-like protein Pup [Candidatus Rokuibacteriota bacterium]|nr:MAG: ubiquitin-like protein Pup [Candidatus Rokubacteria bacterium]
MAELKRKEAKSAKALESEAPSAAQSELTKKGEDLKKEMDALVDEIDDILEANAEDFVANYVQRGGE